jgi:hypothetical protein
MSNGSDWPQPDSIPDDFVFRPDEMPPPATSPRTRQQSPVSGLPLPPQKRSQQPDPKWGLLRACVIVGYATAALSIVAGFVLGLKLFYASIESGHPALSWLFVTPLAGLAFAVALAFVVQLADVIVSIERNTRNRVSS